MQGREVQIGRIECVENYGRSVVLHCLHAYKLICPIFIDSDGRQKIPGSETKDIYSQHSRQCVLYVHINFPCSTGPTEAMCRWAQVDKVHTVDLCHSWGTLKLGNLMYKGKSIQLIFAPKGDITCIILNNEQNSLLFQEKTLCLLNQGYLPYKFLEKLLQNQAINASSSWTARNARDPWRIASV